MRPHFQKHGIFFLRTIRDNGIRSMTGYGEGGCNRPLFTGALFNSYKIFFGYIEILFSGIFLSGFFSIYLYIEQYAGHKSADGRQQDQEDPAIQNIAGIMLINVLL